MLKFYKNLRNMLKGDRPENQDLRNWIREIAASPMEGDQAPEPEPEKPVRKKTAKKVTKKVDLTPEEDAAL